MKMANVAVLTPSPAKEPVMKEHRPEAIDQRLVRALAHPLRVQILEVLTERVASPNLLAEELRSGLSHVAYHTRALDRCGCIELVETAQRRGATEHYYKAKPHAFIGDRVWRKVPRSIRSGVTAASLQTFMDKAVTALEAGTIDDREDTTFSWMPMHLDEEGWHEVTGILAEATERVLAAQAAADRRVEESGQDERKISAVVALANFETGSGRSGAA
jgi:DNA-binding transcriptional ArsR family regulator